MPIDQVVTAAPHEPLTSLLERLAPSGGSRALVVDRGQVVGIVAAIDIGRADELAQIPRDNRIQQLVAGIQQLVADIWPRIT
jgi:CBS-domain-containing membrane protein